MAYSLVPVPRGTGNYLLEELGDVWGAGPALGLLDPEWRGISHVNVQQCAALVTISRLSDFSEFPSSLYNYVCICPCMRLCLCACMRLCMHVASISLA